MKARIPAIAIIALLLCVSISQAFAAHVSKGLQSMETMLEQGKLDDLASMVYSSKATTDEDHAFLSYLNALLKKQQSDCTTLLQQTAERFPSTYYGQLSMLEKAKMHILERDYPSAKKLLTSIKTADITEHYYWLALCAQATDDNTSCLSYCESYLRLTPKGERTEATIYLMAEVLMKQGKYQNAISTLNKLTPIAGYPRNKQYYNYQMGLLYRKLDDPQQSLQYLKTGFEIDRNTQLAFLIEDSLLELKDRYGDRIDLSFLYPFTEAEIPDYNPAPPNTPQPPTNLNSPMKLSAKPTGGFFIQAGRFVVVANAEKLCGSIRQHNVSANYFEDKSNKSTPWVVISGPYNTKAEADAVRQLLIGNNIECFVTKF